MNVWERAIGITAGIMQECQMGKQECEGRAGAVGSKGPRGGSGAQGLWGGAGEKDGDVHTGCWLAAPGTWRRRL